MGRGAEGQEARRVSLTQSPHMPLQHTILLVQMGENRMWADYGSVKQACEGWLNPVESFLVPHLIGQDVGGVCVKVCRIQAKRVVFRV